MEDLPGSRSALTKHCFQVVAPQDFAAFPLNKKYHLIDCLHTPKEDFQLVCDDPSEHVFLIPYQFPFIFKITRRRLQAGLGLAALDRTFRSLNTMKRIQVVRSIIPKKTVFTNLQTLNSEPIGEGCLKISIIDPLSGLELRQSTHRLDLIQAKNNFCSHVDFEQPDYRRESGPLEAILIDSRCKIMFLGLTVNSAYFKSSKFLLFFEELKKPKRKSDLFFCLAKLRAGLVLKLYFTPVVVGPADSSASLSNQSAPQQLGLRLSKIWVCIEKSLLSTFSHLRSRPGPLETSDNRAVKPQPPPLLQNYRLNVSSGISEMRSKKLSEKLVSGQPAKGYPQLSPISKTTQAVMFEKPSRREVVEAEQQTRTSKTHANMLTFFQSNNENQTEKPMPVRFDNSGIMRAKIESCHQGLRFAGHFFLKVEEMLFDRQNNMHVPSFSFSPNSYIDSNSNVQRLDTQAQVPNQLSRTDFRPSENLFLNTRESTLSKKPNSSPLRRRNPKKHRCEVQATANIDNRSSCVGGQNRKNKDSDEGEQTLQQNLFEPDSSGLRISRPSLHETISSAQSLGTRGGIRDPLL